MAFVRTATITCVIIDDNKEKPGSFNVQLLQGGDLIYERDHWGLNEDWDNGTTHATTSINLSHRQVPAHGTYVLNVVIDSGDNIDVNADWSVTILDTDGQTLVSDPYRYKFEKDVREFETSYAL